MIIQTISIKSVTAQGMGTLSVLRAAMMCPLTSSASTISTAHRRAPSAAATPTRPCARCCGAPYGSILIRLDDGHETSEVLLNDPAKGLIVEHNMWREMLWQKDDSVLCVAADSYYDADDYIRDYDEFKKRVSE